MNDRPAHILVLAASRGPQEALARDAGVANKCLIPVDGVPMIERVLRALRQAFSDTTISVAIEDPELLDRLPEARVARAMGAVRVMAPGGSPSRTVLAALDQTGVRPPLLVTTADHALLTSAMVTHFWRSVPRAVDAAAAIASRTTIRAVWPQTRRTYLRFRDDSYSGCNLFAVLTPEGRRVVAFWEQAEARRKRPVAMMRLLGPAASLSFLIGTLSLAAAVSRLERQTGTRLAAVDMPYADAAVDVDKPEDLALAHDILRRRRDVGGAAHAASLP